MIRLAFPHLCLAAAAALIPAVTLAAPEPVEPAASPIKVGLVNAWALRDALNVVPNDGSVFGVDLTPAAVAAVLRAAGAPADKVTLAVDALLVRTNGRVALIDTGLGPKAGGVLIRSLSAAGVTPARVTDVLVTHGHPDHIGGLLDAAGRLAFPNATIHMSAPEWAALKGRTEAAALVKAITPKVRPFAPGVTVIPGITAVALPGHTPGHSAYRITSGITSLLDIGDSAHSSIVSLAHPEWAIQYDADQTRGRLQRTALLAKLAATGERVWAPHFPFPGTGKIVKRGTGYALVAEK